MPYIQDMEENIDKNIEEATMQAEMDTDHSQYQLEDLLSADPSRIPPNKLQNSTWAAMRSLGPPGSPSLASIPVFTPLQHLLDVNPPSRHTAGGLYALDPKPVSRKHNLNPKAAPFALSRPNPIRFPRTVPSLSTASSIYASPSALSPTPPHGSTTKDNTLKEFTLFKNLALELRQKIWQLSFEKRHVDFSIVQKRRDSGKQRTKHTRFPAAWSVCRESRVEVELFYKLLLPSEGRSHRARDGYVAFLPGVDSMSISLRDAGWPIHSVQQFDRHVGKVMDGLGRFEKLLGGGGADGGLNVVEELEIRDLDVCWCFFDMVMHRGYGRRLVELLGRFKGMKNLCVTVAARSLEGAVERRGEEFGEWLGRNLGVGKREGPEVVVREWAAETGEMPGGFKRVEVEEVENVEQDDLDKDIIVISESVQSLPDASEPDVEDVDADGWKSDEDTVIIDAEVEMPFLARMTKGREAVKMKSGYMTDTFGKQLIHGAVEAAESGGEQRQEAKKWAEFF